MNSDTKSTSDGLAGQNAPSSESGTSPDETGDRSETDSAFPATDTEYAEYVPTEQELVELAKYWLAKQLNVHTNLFWGEPVNHEDCRRWDLAEVRLDRIAAVLSADRIQEARCEVEEEFRRGMGEKAWHLFKHGTRAEISEFLAATLADEEDEGESP